MQHILGWMITISPCPIRKIICLSFSKRQLFCGPKTSQQQQGSLDSIIVHSAYEATLLLHQRVTELAGYRLTKSHHFLVEAVQSIPSTPGGLAIALGTRLSQPGIIVLSLFSLALQYICFQQSMFLVEACCTVFMLERLSSLVLPSRF